MRSGKVEQATALAGKIGYAIKNYNKAELSRLDVLVDPRNMWAKVRQLSWRTKSIDNQVFYLGITADIWNDRYSVIYSGTSYVASKVKPSASISDDSELITEWRMFKILDTSRHFASGLDKIPVWFLRTGAPFFAASIASVMNLSFSTLVVPSPWKSASILLVAKFLYHLCHQISDKIPSHQSALESLSAL